MTSETQASELNERADLLPAVEVAGSTAKEGDEIYLLEVLITIAERKRLIFAITAFFAIVAIVVSLIMPKRFTATLTLLPPQQNSSMAGAMSSQLSGLAALTGGSLGIKNPTDMYVAMFKSRTVEDGMVQRFGLMQEYGARRLSDASRTFEDHVTVEAGTKDGLIHISVMDGDPHRAAELANGYVDQFRVLSQHLAITEASQRRLFFEQELELAKENLANAEEAMKRTEQATGVMQVETQARALTEAAATLRAQITAREVQIQGLQTYATGENAQVVQAQKELDSLRAEYAKVGGSEETPGAELVIPKGKVPEAGLEYMRKLRDVKYYETIFDILARQFELAKLDEAKQGALIQVVDPAVAPDARSSPRRGLIVIGATAIGFFLGVIVALLQAWFQRLKENPEATENLQSLRRAILPKVFRRQ